MVTLCVVFVASDSDTKYTSVIDYCSSFVFYIFRVGPVTMEFTENVSKTF